MTLLVYTSFPGLQVLNIILFPVSIAANFVTLSWNTSQSLARDYILQVYTTSQVLSRCDSGDLNLVYKMQLNFWMTKGPYKAELTQLKIWDYDFIILYRHLLPKGEPLLEILSHLNTNPFISREWNFLFCSNNWISIVPLSCALPQVYQGKLKTNKCEDNPYLEYDSIEVGLCTDI